MRRRVSLLLLMFLVPAGASAQTPPARSLRVAAPSTPFLSLDSAAGLAPGQFAIGVGASVAGDPLILYSRGRKVGDVVNAQIVADLAFGVGVLRWLEVDVAYSAIGAQGASLGGGSLPSLAAGDLRVGPKLILVRPRAAGSPPVRVAILTEGVFPTGPRNAFAGELRPSFQPRLLLETFSGPFTLGLTLGYRLREGITVGDLRWDDEIVYGLGVSVALLGRSVELMAEIQGLTPAAHPFEREVENPLEGIAGVRYRTRRGLVLTAGGGAGLLPGYGSPLWRAVASVGFAPPPREIAPPPRVPDRDGDGVPDATDQCPDDPGPAAMQGCPDSDGDGVPDHRDQCPYEHAGPHGAPVGDGCPRPEPDRDGDGTPDAHDACPDDPGPRSWQGCPDSDGDGIPDHLDRCPFVAEDKDGYADEDGCPEPDNDQDRIPDGSDAEPLEPELPMALRIPQPTAQATERVIVQTARIFILDKILFRPRTAVILSESTPVLDRIAQVVRAHDHIVKLRIDGHTEKIAGWSAKRMARLSEEMVRAVLRYLVKKGVEVDRLALFGFGARRPIDSNRTPEGRTRNRRVEFVVIEQ